MQRKAIKIHAADSSQQSNQRKTDNHKTRKKKACSTASTHMHTQTHCAYHSHKVTVVVSISIIITTMWPHGNVHTFESDAPNFLTHQSDLRSKKILYF